MTEQHLSLEKIAIENDVYLAYWIRSLKPVYDIDTTYDRFMETNRTFCETILHLTPSDEEYTSLREKNKIFLPIAQTHVWRERIESLLSPVLSLKNNLLGYISRKIIKRNMIAFSADGLVVDDDMVKIHTHDRRSDIRSACLSGYVSQ